MRRLTVGGTVFARVTRDWNGLGCSLRQGSILEATVELAEAHKVRSESKLGLAFSKAQCNGAEMKPMELLLSAVAQVPADWENVPDAVVRTQVVVTDRLTGESSTGVFRSSGFGFSMSRMELKGIIHHFPMSAKVQPGDVIDIKGMKLDLGTGPNRSSVLAIKGRDVSLEKYTQFLLVPASLVFVSSNPPKGSPADLSAMSGSATVTPVSSAPKVTNDLEVCAPPGCVVDLPVTSEELKGRTEESIAIRPLGYTPRPAMSLGDFTEDEALVWLGPGQLLFAFNAHQLIRREGVPNELAARRIIRAVLLDAKNRTVVRAVDWEITDSHRYLWTLPHERVLVHIGNELRVYGAGLNVEQSISLAGPLAFIRISPNGELITVATFRERHSLELHAKLQDDLSADPEEDVDVTVLDRTFNTIAQTHTISGLEPPTLLNEGQVTLLAQPNNHYRLALDTEDSHSITLAQFASLCAPEVSSVPPDFLFLLTCNMATNHAEYRVLRSDGKLLMRGEAGSSEIDEEAAGTQSSDLFAVKVVHASRELSRGMEFKGEDLDFEEVRIYRTSDGKRLRAFRVDEPTTSHGGYAISLDGSQVAVLSGSQIHFFSLPKR
jgi:hypothetical protein